VKQNPATKNTRDSSRMRAIVSVIIPTFNRAEYAVEAVESVFAQTFTDFEVIVIDDGSTDGTRERLASFRDFPNFQYSYQVNAGRSTARNQGIAKARGEFLLFLDSDDRLLPNALADLLDLAARQQAAEMIVGQTQFVDEQLRQFASLSPTVEGGMAYPDLINERFFLLPGAFVVKKTSLEKIGVFDALVEPCEDYDFALRAALHGEVACADVPVVQHRMHGSNTPSTAIFLGGIRVARKHLHLIDDTDELSLAVRRRSRAKWMLRMGDNYYGLGDNAGALKNYLRALVVDPARLLFNLRVHRQILASFVPFQVRERLKPMLFRRERLNAD
jgi:glycosyltransferase involved in cell wall biosynthesis